MYAAFKKLVKSVLPQKLMWNMEFPLRNLYYPMVQGNARTCPCCRRGFKSFAISEREDFHDEICPGCGSLSRTRLLWLYLEKNQLAGANTKLLHFSPHRYLRRLIMKRSDIQYLDTDYDTDRCRHQFDICALPLEDESQDLIISYHIFEHIPDDLLAMRECFRVLKSGGLMLSQVPWSNEQTVEDPSITDPAERLRLFGQEDHVRYYGKSDFVARLGEARFEVEEVLTEEICSEDEIQQMALRKGEVIFVCRKN